MPFSKTLAKIADTDPRIVEYEHDPGNDMGEHWLHVADGYGWDGEPGVAVHESTVKECVQALKNVVATTPTPTPTPEPAPPKPTGETSTSTPAVTSAKELRKQLKGMKTLGDIVTWNPRSESTHTFADVTTALAAAGLDVDVARELLPRNAFARSVNKMKGDKLIEECNQTEDTIVYQVTAKFLEQEAIRYQPETFIRLNKTTGKVTCKDLELEQRMQERLDEAMEHRTTNDITRIVQRLFESNADLFPIREQGGAYFVPACHTAFVTRVKGFLEALGGYVSQWPIAAGTDQGNKAVQASVASAMEGLIQEHNQAVEAFTLHTRPDTIQAAAEKIKETRVKIEAYASYLQDRSAGLLSEVEAANAKLIKQVQELSEQRAEMPATSKDGKFVFGHKVTAVIRWMGKEGWEFEGAKQALAHFGVEPADATIQAALGHGRRGQRGEPAALAAEQIKSLEKARDEAAQSA